MNLITTKNRLARVAMTLLVALLTSVTGAWAQQTIPFTESFGTSKPEGWSMYFNNLDEVQAGTALESTDDAWDFGSINGVFDDHAYAWIHYSTSRWLVTPLLNLIDNLELTFSLALTSANAERDEPNPTDGRFIVLVSTDGMSTWTILREWNNSGSSYVYNDIPHNATGEDVSISLSDYANKNVYIAFYAESYTTSTPNRLHIDNVSVDHPRSLLTVNDGTTNNEFVPVYGYYVDDKSYSQFIIPAAELADMQWGTINKMTFYADKTSVDWYDAKFEVYMTETTETTLSALADWTKMEKVMNEAHLEISDGKMVVTLDAPYLYMGGNLMIGIKQTDSGSWDRCTWTGVSATGASMGGYGDSDVNQQDFLPKTTFAYTPSTLTCFKPTGLTVNYDGGSEATLSWTSGAEAWNIDVNGTVTAITENPYTLTGLDLATTYEVKVQANCGDGDVSQWSDEVTFTTPICDVADQCIISYALEDSYGDGWNGNYIEVTDHESGVVIATLTIANGSAANGEFAACPGRQIDFTWYGSNFTDECSYAIYDVNGDEIFSGKDVMAGVFEHIVDCTIYNMKCPIGLTVSQIGPNSAKLSWTEKGDATQWQICVNGDEVNLQTTDKNPITIQSLDAKTVYTVKVRAVKGDEFSRWSEAVTFTTTEPCPKPNDMAVKPLITGASVSWTGFNEEYTLRYRLPEYPETTFFENFENGLPDTWTTIDNDGDGYSWSGMQRDADRCHSGTGIATSASYINNVGSLTPDNWLITPQLNLQGTMRVWLRAQDPNYPKEHFAIYLSTTGNAVDDFTTVLVGETEATGDYVEYTADLRSYAGQTGYIAIRHFNCINEFYLNLDDFGIYTGETIPAGEWQEITTDETVAEITGLNVGTTYEYQIQGSCDGNATEWTDMATFTTLDERSKLFLNNGDWTVAGNWEPAGVPTAGNDVYIFANVTVPAGQVAEANAINIDGGSITLKDKAQLHCQHGVEVTIEKNIKGYGTGNGGFNFITTPVEESISPADVEGALNGEYDLYDFSVANANEWGNYKGNGFTLGAGNAYLYANSEDQRLVFKGTAWPSMYNTLLWQPSMGNSVNDAFYGWYLISNIFPCNGYLYLIDSNYNLQPANFFKMNEAGDGFDMYRKAVELAPCEGALIERPGGDYYVLFSTYDLFASGYFDGEMPTAETAPSYVPALPAHALTDNQDATPTLHLADNGNNSDIIAEAGGHVYNVELTNRTLFKDNNWNTLYLPFSITNINAEGNPLNGAVVRELDDASISGTTLTLNFKDATTAIEAGTPYIVMWEVASNSTISDPVFNDVIIDKTVNNYDNEVSGDTRVRFLGTYDAITFNNEGFTEDRSILFLGDENTLYYPQVGVDEQSGNNVYPFIGACRAYFKIGEDGAGARQITGFNLNFGDGETSGIITTNYTDRTDATWFTIDGKKLDKAPTRKGLYILNGKKVVIK